MSTAFWIAWIALFVVLEVIGLRSGSDSSYTLTNRIRAAMRAHPALRWLIRAAIAVGLLWLFGHFVVVDPFLNPGA